MLGRQDAAVAHQPDGAARRECTSAEAEEVQIVTRLVVLDQKAVAVAHVAGEAKAEGTAAHALEAPGADARVVEEELRVAVAVLAGDAQSDLGHVGGSGHAVLARQPDRSCP